MMKQALLGTGALVCAALAGYPQDASATACDSGTFDGAFAGEVVVPQNWDCDQRQAFWFTDQGSQVIPYVWFLHLEQAASTAKFSDPANMDRYRYLPQRPTPLNPDGLPIGFTKGTAKANKAYRKISDDWLGMTCSACHTGQVEYQGAKYLIDGAPTMADFESMMQDLAKAMQATLDDEAKFERFAAAVIADSQARGSGGTDNRKKLRRQLEGMTAIRHDWNELNKGTSPYGHARLDAIGAIFNAVATTGLGEPGNAAPPDAPVSYPFIWDTPQHDKVQWNGSVTNAGPGALGRNVGEVLGVFGTLKINTRRILKTGHASSIDVEGLGKLEQLAWELQSPLWRDTSLPKIDEAKLAEGREAFEEYCVRCHRDIVRDDPNRRIKARMFPVFNPKNADDPNALGTDIATARNFLTRTSSAHRLNKRFLRYWGFLSKFKRFEPEDQDAAMNAQILGYAVIGAITRELLDNPKQTIRAIRAGQPPKIAEILDTAEQRAGGTAGTDGKPNARKYLEEIGREIEEPELDRSKPTCFPDGVLECYKARPLNGIWATAPYLHNGSVRTMRQLLLPASQRERSFQVGTREFDPVDMGFRNEGAFTLDTSLPGNSNAGHDGPIYGNDELARDPRRLNALLEYLKTL